MVTSPYEWKILEWDEKHKQTNWSIVTVKRPSVIRKSSFTIKLSCEFNWRLHKEQLTRKWRSRSLQIPMFGNMWYNFKKSGFELNSRHRKKSLKSRKSNSPAENRMKRWRSCKTHTPFVCNINVVTNSQVPIKRLFSKMRKRLLDERI